MTTAAEPAPGGPEMRATWLSRGRLLIPAGGRIPGGLWVHAACRRPAVVANTLSGHLVRVSPRLVPGRGVRMSLPFPDDVRDELIEHVPRLGSRAGWVVLLPTDARRARIMILGLGVDRRPSVFVRATLDEPNRHALELLDALAATGSGVVHPKVEEVFRLGEWWVTVETPLPQAAHRPARLGVAAAHELVGSIQSLAPARDGLVCGHGDLGPWNVRRFSDGRVGILDWEYATWSPRATDEVWYATTFRLATTKAPGETIGRSVLDGLRQVYPDDVIGDAARFIVSSRRGPEPPEVRTGVERSTALREFERRLESALEILTG